MSRLRETWSSLKLPVNVWLREGKYFLEKPLVFTTKDSGGGPFCQVTYAAAPGEKVVLSGGRIIQGWTQEILRGKKVWVARLPEVKGGKWFFSQVFVNGIRRPRTRIPQTGFFRVGEVLDAQYEGTLSETVRRGTNRFVYREGDIQEWKNLTDVEAVFPILWTESRMKFQSIDPLRRIATVDRRSHFRLTNGHKKEGARYFIENVFEALEEPGQWYLDRKDGVLYYLPHPGESLENTEVVAPYVEELVRIEGIDPHFPAQHVCFSGLSFEHTKWELPQGKSSAGQAAHEVGSAVVLINTKHCKFSDCSFSHLGGTAMELRTECQDIQISHNRFYDLGGGGIKIWHGCRRNIVSDNLISEGGRRYYSAVGILIGAGAENKILHNEIHHFYHSGISIGWTWGYAKSGATGNQIEGNHIHHLGSNLLIDVAGIYTVGAQSQTVVRNNRIHDLQDNPDGCVVGFLLDEGTSDLLIEDNAVYRTAAGAICCNYGKNITISDNIFINDGWLLLLTRREPHRTLIFERNFVGLKSPHLLEWTHGIPRCEEALFRENVYLRLSGREPIFGSLDFTKWRGTGQDEGSLAAQVGFKKLNLFKVGVRKNEHG